jgi:hypothetical protein
MPVTFKALDGAVGNKKCGKQVGFLTFFHLKLNLYVSMCDLGLGYRDLNFMHNTQSHNDENWCQVILKSLNTCRRLAPIKE